MQVPYEDKQTMKAVEAYMGDHRWDYYINLGDLCDFNEISQWTADSPGAIEEDVADTFDRVNEILDRHQAIVRKNNPHAKFILIEGNHDYRAVSYALKHPGLAKHLNVPRNLRLKERGFQWIPNWSQGKLFHIGNAYFSHGKFTNKYHAAKMAEVYGVAMYYGHTHDVMEFPKVLMGNDKTVVAKSLGCLCRYDQKYLRGNPTNWQQAVSTFYFFPDGMFTEHTFRIFKHRFYADGKVYDGRKQ